MSPAHILPPDGMPADGISADPMPADLHAVAGSEAQFRATFENAPLGIAHLSADGRWVRVNQALCRILAIQLMN